VAGDEIPAVVDVFRFFAGAARCLNGLAAGEYLDGHTSMIRRDPVGVVAYCAVELPADDGGLETGACAGGRELCGDQTLGNHPADGLKLAELAKISSRQAF
jgi:aminobutyraldehyde dehydrogenase